MIFSEETYKTYNELNDVFSELTKLVVTGKINLPIEESYKTKITSDITDFSRYTEDMATTITKVFNTDVNSDNTDEVLKEMNHTFEGTDGEEMAKSFKNLKHLVNMFSDEFDARTLEEVNDYIDRIESLFITGFMLLAADFKNL